MIDAPRPFAVIGDATLYRGDAQVVLRGLPEGSVNCILTSPPFWGLRVYAGVGGEQEQVWGWDETGACEHEWGDTLPGQRRDNQHVDEAPGNKGGGHKHSEANQTTPTSGAYCQKCRCWRGALGGEPSPAQYVQNMVAVFREVKRVLHDSGVCWVNLGTSYAASGGPAGNQTAETKFRQPKLDRASAHDDYKPTDLVGIPWLVAEALREDGWYLRKVMPWVKPSSAMPESVTSRPGSAIEWWLMLTKQPGGGAYYDAEAIRKPHKRLWGSNNGGTFSPGSAGAVNVGRTYEHRGDYPLPNFSGRAFRDADLFMASLEGEIDAAKERLAHLEACRKDGGLVLDEDGEPLALLCNPVGFKGGQYLGDWSRKEWRSVDPNDPEKGSRRVEVWYIAAPDCEAHAHYHRPDKWERLGYADGREIEARAGDVDGAKCACAEVKVDHYAVFGIRVVEPLIRASCPREVCAKCGAPKAREVRRHKEGLKLTNYGGKGAEVCLADDGMRSVFPRQRTGEEFTWRVETVAWNPTCDCNAGFEPGTVLDCFSGSGTCGVVAKREGLAYIGIDCSRDYLVMSERRLAETGKSKVAVAAERGGQGSLFDEGEA